MSEKIKIGSLADLIEDELVPFSVEGVEVPVAVAQIGGRVYAIEDLCSHAKCALSDGLIEEETIGCPCHGASFDLDTGEALNPPAVKPIKCYEVNVEGEDIYIKL